MFTAAAAAAAAAVFLTKVYFKINVFGFVKLTALTILLLFVCVFAYPLFAFVYPVC